MKRHNIVATVVIIMLSASALIGQQKQIIGYYPSWQWGKRNNLVTTKALPYDKFTIINYAFLYPAHDGGIVGVDTLAHAEDVILNGERDAGNGGYVSGTSLAARAHQHNIKVMVSIGGWEGSLEFSQIAADPKKRAAFAKACVRRIVDHGFDGIDIDWEFPGYADHNGIPADKQNFTLFLKEIRDSLTALEKRTGKSYLLTAALPSGGPNADNMEIEKIAPLLDFLNIMTYDFSGGWSPVSGHNAPLYAGRLEDSSLSVDAAFRLYHEKYGIPSQKINLGAPFYARTFGNCGGIYAAHTGPDGEHFPDGGAYYYELLPRMGEFNRYWDEKAKVPYLLAKNFRTFITYDDEESISLKAQYVADNNAAGLIIWEITADYLPDRKTPLLDAINKIFRVGAKNAK
jgi:chitinase